MDKSNKLTPIEQLKEDKRRLKKVCMEDSERMQEHWNYLSDNMGILLFNTALNTTKSVISSKKAKQKEKDPFRFLSSLKAGSPTSMLNVFNTALPFVWEIAQPILIGFVVKKIKGLFTSKKKKS